jgi:hypothetical protein
MAYQISKPAKGDAENTGAPGPTPAPTKETAFGRGSYGANAYGGPSSIEPGAKSSSPMADAIRDAQNDGQDVLGKIQAHGVTGSPSPQTRAISSEPLPPAHGMRSRTASGGSPGDKVPNK